MKIKEIVTVIAIGVLFALFVGLLVDAVYEEPEYDEFCRLSNLGRPKYAPEPARPGYLGYNASCPEPYQDERVQRCQVEEGSPVFNRSVGGCDVYEKCDYCGRDFNEAQKRYNRNIFFIISPVAIVAIIVGLVVTLQFIGSGLILGGILLLIYSTARYFSDMSKVVRVVVIFVELVIVVVLAFKKLERSGKKR